MPHVLLPAFARANATEIVRRLRASQASCAKVLLVHNDVGSGVGATVWMMSLAMLLAVRSGRAMLEAPDARSCARPPHTLECVYAPWSPCAIAPPPRASCPRVDPRAVVAKASAPCLEISLRAFHRSRMWYGLGRHTFRSPLAFALTEVLAAPTEATARCAEQTVRRCVDGREFAFVHVRDSPEKRREQRGRLVTSTSAYLEAAAKHRLPIVWSAFHQTHRAAIAERFPDACFVNQTVGIHDERASNVLDANACSAEVARRAAAYVGATQSMMTWLSANSPRVRTSVTIGEW